jgi:hypothetical protein
MIPPVIRRGVFVLYAIVLFVATHWPKLKIESVEIERPDILIHIGAFAAWSWFLLFSGVVRQSSVWKTAGLAWVCGAIYAGIDESLQAIPIVQRTAAWDDYIADVGGVTLGCLVWLAGAAMRQRSVSDTRDSQ